MRKIAASVAACALLLSAGSAALYAQASATPRENITVPIGSIFEILAATSRGTQINWVLTHAGETVSSSTEATFRTRLAREGNYTLTAEAGNTQRIFQLLVRQRRPEDTVRAQNPGDAVAFDPPLLNGNINVNSVRQVLTATPVRNDIKVLAIDIDIAQDSNGDGNSGNDEDTRTTLFRSDGNALHIWFVGGLSRTIRLGSLQDGKQPEFENITVGPTTGQRIDPGIPPMTTQPTTPTTPTPQPTPVEPTPVVSDYNGPLSIRVVKNDNGTVRMRLEAPEEEQSPLIVLWSFGDGAQSMLDEPIHTYAESGNYSISAEVRNLATGKVVTTLTDSLVVNRLREQPIPVDEDEEKTPVDPEPEPEPEPEPQPEEKEGSGILGLVIKLILALVFFAALGAGIMFLIAKIKKRGFSLEKSLEKAEQVMVSGKEEKDVSDVAPPMEISAEEVETPVVEPVTDEPSETTPPEPTPPEPTPPAPPEPTPPSPPEPTPPTPAPEPAAPTPTPSDSAQGTSAPTDAGAAAPDWLSAGMQAASAPEPTSAEPPAPPVAPEPAPTPEPTPPEPTPPAPEQAAPAAPDAGPNWLTGDTAGAPPTEPAAAPEPQVAPPPPEPTPAVPEPAPAAVAPEPAPTADAAAPDWLSAGAQPAPATPEPTPPAPEPAPATPEPAPPAEAPVAPEPAPVVETPAVPETPTAEPAPAETTEPRAPMAPSTEQLASDANNAPDWLQAGIEQAEAMGQTVETPLEEQPQPAAPAEPAAEEATEAPAANLSPEDAAREEALREKKRRKRQRYRENVKKRKADEANGTEEVADQPVEGQLPDSEPIAFVTAEEVAPDQAAAPEPPAPPVEQPEQQPPTEPENPQV